MKTIINSIKNNYMILMIVFIGFVFRFIGFNWGGEESIFYPDEKNIVDYIIEMTNKKTLIYSCWTYPSMVSSKVIAVILMGVSFFYKLKWIDYYYFSRFVYVLFSTVIIYLSYVLINKSEGKRTALLFSFFIAINPSFILVSKDIIGDTPVAMFWLIVTLFMIKYVKDKRVRDLILMSFFAACATMEKWNGAGITIFIAIVVIYYNINNLKRLLFHGCISLFSWIISVIIIAPNIITEWDKMIRMIKEANGSLGSKLIYAQLNYFFSYTGIFTILLFLLGIFYVIYDKSGEKVLDRNIARFSYMITIIALIEDWLLAEESVERHGLVIFWGCTLFVILGYVKLRETGKIWKRLGIVIIIFIAIGWLVQSMTIDVVAVRTRNHDTRAKVGSDFLKNLGSTLDNSTGEYYTPYNPPFASNVMEINDINDIIFLDEKGEPCVSVPNKKYIIIGQYSWKDRTGEGYEILRTYSREEYKLYSQYDISIFGNPLFSSGEWYYLELDTIRNAIGKLYTLSTCESFGPWIKVYDISNFKYQVKE